MDWNAWTKGRETYFCILSPILRERKRESKIRRKVKTSIDVYYQEQVFLNFPSLSSNEKVDRVCGSWQVVVGGEGWSLTVFATKCGVMWSRAVLFLCFISYKNYFIFRRWKTKVFSTKWIQEYPENFGIFSANKEREKGDDISIPTEMPADTIHTIFLSKYRQTQTLCLAFLVRFLKVYSWQKYVK